MGTSHLKAGVKLEGTFPRWRTHMAVGRRPGFLTMRASPKGCLSVSTAWPAAFPSDPRERLKLTCAPGATLFIRRGSLAPARTQDGTGGLG